jgi:hypothetical protein
VNSNFSLLHSSLLRLRTFWTPAVAIATPLNSSPRRIRRIARSDSLSFVPRNGLRFQGVAAATPQIQNVMRRSTARLLAVLDGRRPTASYRGYGACPVTTVYARVLMAELDDTGRPAPFFRPPNTLKERDDMWLLKRYARSRFFVGMGC